MGGVCQSEPVTRLRERSVPLAGAAGLMVHLWLLTAGRFDVFARRPGADFFDAQADAWLHGRWWVPRSVVGIEGFVVDGNTHMYFGPFPALLRLPVALVGGAPGRLTVVSMLLAAGAATWAAVRLFRQLTGDAPRWVAAALAFVVPAGTTLAFLSGLTLVYHEAAVWGIATALLSFTFLVDAVERAATRDLVLTTAAVTACALSRVSVAFGPIIALGLLVLVRALRVRRVRPALALPLVPIGAMAAVNMVRFGTLVSVPFRQQVQSSIDPHRPAFFAANGGSFFNLDFLPTTVFHYLQPLGLRPSGWWPFVEFPPPGRVLGSATFDLVDRTASIPATMPAFVLLALVGAVVVVRRGTLATRLVAVGGVLAAGPVLVFGYVANRYLADFVPGLVVLALVGLGAVVPVVARRKVALAGLGLLAALGVWANVGLGVVQQRVWGPQVDREVVRDFTATRLSVDRRLHLARPVVHRVDALPESVGAGDWVVVGACDALYLETGVPVGFLPMGHWRPVEQAGAGITVRVRVDSGDRGVVAEIDDGAGPSRLSIRGRRDGHWTLRWDGRPDPMTGPTFSSDGSLDLEITADPHVDQLVVRVSDRVVLESIYLGDGGITVKRGDLLPDRDPAVCRALLRSAEERGSVR
jgi:hypothetical protein